jgi:2-polyprenyl-3-methyl-5-hydroxy-6-metoxy-1,4-benzoquinol methylase
MTTGNDWREAVGRTWADNYRLTDRSFAGLTERLLARIGGCEGKAVLDIGCVAGELSLAIARGNDSAEVIGVDVPRASAARVIPMSGLKKPMPDRGIPAIFGPTC